MDWKKTIIKSLQGFLTYAIAYLSLHPEIVVSLIPEDIAKMTVGGAIAAILVGLSNWCKHRSDGK